MSSSENTAFHAFSSEETADILKTDTKEQGGSSWKFRLV